MADIPKVKRNIQRMIDQGAPETDIDAYVASEGVSLGQLQAPAQPQQMGYVEDTVRSLGSGVAQLTEDVGSGLSTAHGALSGLIGSGLTYAGASPETAKTWGDRAATAWMPLTALGPERETVKQYIPDALRHDPQTVPGEIAYRVGHDAPVMFAMPGGGSMVNRGVSALGAAVGGYGAKEGAEYVDESLGVPEEYRPWIEGGADVLGSVAGSFTPSFVRNVVTPNPMTSDRKKLADILDAEGVDTTAGQRTGNQNLHYKESQTGGTAYSNMVEEQKRQFSGGALKKGGIAGEQVASPAVLQAQRDKLGAEFERLQNYGVNPDNKFISDLFDVRNGYLAETAESQRIPLIEKSINDLQSQASQGVPIDGQWLKNLGTNLRKARERFRAGGKQVEAEYVDNLIEVMDDATERTLAQVAPDEVGKFGEVRKLYRNLITIEEAASRKTSGVLSPDDLVAATKKMETRRGYARGFGPFNDYARAGKELMTEPPNSGTANRFAAKIPALAQFGNLPAIAGAAGGYLMGGTTGAMVGGGLGAMVEGGINRMRLSPRMQQYLANQLAADWDTATGAGRRAVAAGGAAGLRSMEKR